jgi:hypothetical protein
VGTISRLDTVSKDLSELAAGRALSLSHAQLFPLTSNNSAREIVTKAVERILERVRRLPRLTISKEIREFNRHEFTNAGGSGTPTFVSGIYLWVEKIQLDKLGH